MTNNPEQLNTQEYGEPGKVMKTDTDIALSWVDDYEAGEKAERARIIGICCEDCKKLINYKHEME